mgnify:FL=1
MTSLIQMLPQEIWDYIDEIVLAQEMADHKKPYSRVMAIINDINEVLLEPDEIQWGPMTREEIDDYFNWVHEDQEWGTKSLQILGSIRANGFDVIDFDEEN